MYFRKKLGAKHTIARINDDNIINETVAEHFYNELGIDTLIFPTHLATLEIERLINQAAFTDDIEFDNGKLMAFGISLSKKSILIDKSVRESADLNPNLSFKPLALHRNDLTLLVDADTLKENDIVYFISLRESIENIITLCGKTSIEIRDVMIIGGSRIGLNIAKLLEKNYNISLVEKDKAKCEQLASILKKH